MKYLFLLLAITNCSFAQTILSERFNNFLNFPTDSLQLLCVFDNTYVSTVALSDSVGFDLSGNNRNLTFTGGSAWRDSLILDNPLYSGGNALRMTGNTHHWGIASASFANPGENDFSVIYWFIKRNDLDFPFTGHGWFSNGGWAIQAHSGGLQLGVKAKNTSGTIYTSNYTNTYASLTDDVHQVVSVFNRTSDKLESYLDGDSALADVDISGNFSLTSPLEIQYQTNAGPVGFNLGVIAFAIYNRKLTAQEIKQNYALASGWVSKNDGVIRANFGFNQGIVNDTIYYNTALASGSWTITLSDSAASGVNYEVLTSSDATAWTTLASGTTGTAWGSKSYIGTGTGYIAIAVASGTAFFDDLIVTRGNNNKFKYNKNSIYSTYLK